MRVNRFRRRFGLQAERIRAFEIANGRHCGGRLARVVVVICGKTLRSIRNDFGGDQVEFLTEQRFCQLVVDVLDRFRACETRRNLF